MRHRASSRPRRRATSRNCVTDGWPILAKYRSRVTQVTHLLRKGHTRARLGLYREMRHLRHRTVRGGSRIIWNDLSRTHLCDRAGLASEVSFTTTHQGEAR